jgi:hypothetical protein
MQYADRSHTPCFRWAIGRRLPAHGDEQRGWRAVWVAALVRATATRGCDAFRMFALLPLDATACEEGSLRAVSPIAFRGFLAIFVAVFFSSLYLACMLPVHQPGRGCGQVSSLPSGDALALLTPKVHAWSLCACLVFSREASCPLMG